MNIDINTLFNKAHRLQQKGQLPEAIQCYERLLTLSPNHVDALHFLGLTYAQLNNIEKTIIYLCRALEQQPTNAKLHNNLANAYKKAQMIDKSIHHYQQAIHLEPHYAQAYNNLAGIYALQNNVHQALENYRLAIHEQPDFAAAHYNLGLLLLKNKQLEAAKKQFNNVLTLQPEHTEAQFYLGVLFLESNQIEDAKQTFENILAINNEHVEALTNLGVIALKQDKAQLAIDYFTKALGIDNQHEDARNNLAATFIHHDRFENALMHYDVLLKQTPHNIEYLYNAGVAQMALGHLQEAIEHFETILALQNDHFSTLTNLAAIQMRLEDREKAIKLFERASLAKPDDEASRFMLDALTGRNKKPTASPTYVSNLFDNYALYYEQHLQNSLHYTLPHQIAQLVHRLNLTRVNNAIDLGCGTGLCGNVLRELSTHLTGVDISTKMLAQANNKGIYDQLVEAELITFLQHDQQKYQLAIAADVLPYLGELDTLFATLSQRMNREGFFILTHEISENYPWQLQKSARFCHHPDYIKNLCKDHGFNILSQQNVIARQQNQCDLKVIMYALLKHT